MVVVSYSGREINAKIVYYGPGLSGKTTNLEKIYDSVPESNRGRMVSMKTQTDRTLFFDLLPLDLGELSGMKTRFLLYTVPGQVYYNATRKLVLKGVDAIVFVADSARDKMTENRESLTNLETNLKTYGLDLQSIPWVLQYNKRDLPDAVSVEEMDRELNRHAVPTFEAQAANGIGVFETLRGVSKMLLNRISKEVMDRERGNLATPQRVASAEVSPEPAAVATPPPPPAEPEKKSSRFLQFLKRGKQDELPAPEPLAQAAPTRGPVGQPEADQSRVERETPTEPSYLEPAPFEPGPILTDADLVDDVAGIDASAPASAGTREYVLTREDLIPEDSQAKGTALVPAAASDAFHDGIEIERGRSYAGPIASRPASRAEPRPGSAPGGDRVTVPIEIGPIPASGRIRLTFEIRVEVVEEASRGPADRSDSGEGEINAQDFQIYR